jgi:hypothetical protein
MSGGKDLRSERLTDRKHELRRLLSKAPTSRMRYVEHVEQYGTALFERVCKMGFGGDCSQAQLWKLRDGAGADDLVQNKEPELFADGGTGEAVR